MSAVCPIWAVLMLPIKCPHTCSPQAAPSLCCVLTFQLRTFLLGHLGLSSPFAMAVFCHPNSPIVSVNGGVGGAVVITHSTKADSELKEIAAHGNTALSTSLIWEMRRFISNHGLKTI